MLSKVRALAFPSSTGCIGQKVVCYVFCVISFLVFFFRMALVIAALADPCDFEVKHARDSDGLQLCLSSTDIVFRVLIISINGIILVGHFVGLLTEDRMLCGMVLGAELLNLIGELMTKLHVALTLLDDFELTILLTTVVFFVIEFLTCTSFSTWVCTRLCRPQSTIQRHLRSPGRDHHCYADDDEQQLTPRR